MRTDDLILGADYEITAAHPGDLNMTGATMRATYDGASGMDGYPLRFVYGDGKSTARSARGVLRPWSERVAEQHERAEREREAEEREAAMFAATYGDIPERTVASLSLLNIAAQYRGQPDISGMTCVLDIEGSTKVMSALFIGLTAADAGTPRRLRLAEPLAEYHAFLLAEQDASAIESFRVSAMGRFSPIELATVLHVANGLRSC